jgi:LPXTG-motif cell wall-anchored protein
MARLRLSGVIILALIAVMTTPGPGGAVTYDKLTYLTFSGPVQVPGVTLNAGTYRFRLTNPETSRNVLQVLSGDGAVVYAMFHTIPESRVSITKDAVVTFRETPAGIPPEVRSLFYGGEHRGYEFVYPKRPAAMAPPAVPQPEIMYEPIAAAPAPEAVAELEAEPIIAEPALEPAMPPPAELPQTATPLPLAALGGLTSLLAGLGFAALRRRVN